MTTARPSRDAGVRVATYVGRAGRLCVLGAATVLAVFPIYWMVTTATHTERQIYANHPPLVPSAAHFGNLFATSGGVPILRWLGNSAFVAIGTVVLSLALALLAAYALSRYRFHGKSVIGIALFATQMLPEALLVVPLYAIFLYVGALNSLWSLILSDTAFAMPVAVWIIKAAIDRVPFELEEAARVDGCRTGTILSQITVPLILPSLATAGVLTFFSGWNEYLFANTFINDESSWPASKGLASFIGQFVTPLDAVMAAAIIFAAPAIVFFVIAQKGIVSGLTAGAMKG